MQAYVYEGYFDNGKFYNNLKEEINIPERHKVFLTLLEERQPAKKPFSDLFGKWQGKVWMADDFDAPIEEMGEYMQ